MSNLDYAEVGENSPYAGEIGWGNFDGVIRFSFDNIQVKDRDGNAMNDFSVVIADGDRTNSNEKIECITPGKAWALLTNF
ncbi:hypothetical protein lbkm_1823 [Lachnospiraceae bacterium KM106-2]|nr:hypothetical protein lbkm_1823 [Lachnospiraceae bacterium KM106-2]